ncbi:MAG: S46 family peptidase [Planctomycetes bacterium]|nr:S46 family peptidase [Planctomycetota bacterium]
MATGTDGRGRRLVGLAAALALVALVGGRAGADEGMWTLAQVRGLGLEKKGLAIAAREVYDPDRSCLVRASVNLSGASGALVSARGLVLTNHHVALRGIHQISTTERNYLRDGFHARTPAEERPLRGYTAMVTLRCEDVTAQVLAGLEPEATGAERERHVSARIEALEDEARRKSRDSHERFRVREAFDGAAYYLYATRTYRDVRLVFAPPAAIGEFGGDPDNWMWPRHCGDFTFLRVYAGPDGQPAGHADTNVPLAPERWLKLSPAGVKEGDFTFVLGYPARTHRHVTSHFVRYHRDVLMPAQLKRLEELADRLDAPGRTDEKAALRNAASLKGVLNTLKNTAGKAEWLRKKPLVALLEAEEEELQKRLGASALLWRRYGGALEEVGARYVGLEHGEKVRERIDRALASPVLRAARVLAELGVEKAKPDEQRRREYRDSRRERLETRTLEALRSHDPAADREPFVAAIAAFGDLPDSLLPEVLGPVVAGKSGEERAPALAAFAEEAWQASALQDAEAVRRFFALEARELQALEDPLVRLAAGLAGARAGLDPARGQAGRTKDARRRLFEARRAVDLGVTYPDADGTLRLTFGRVRGYRPRDAVYYGCMTSLGGVVEKETGREPFASPPRLLELHCARDFGRWADSELGGDVPVAFVHDTDITGGNSGSPVLNAHGEMVGIAFDGNWESITSDYCFEPELTRTLSVDIRYVLFVTEKFAGAGHLLEEMGLKGRRL